MAPIENMVIWSDEHMLVINKPAGLPTLVDGWDPDAPHIVGLLKETYHPLWIVHRLDRETSGVLLFALTAEAHRWLNRQFEKRQVQKTYHALVRGSPDWEENEVSLSLRADGDRRHRTVADPIKGKPALTELKVLERFGDFSLIQAMPRTGRTHQIRAHLSLIGLPIAGDQLYGGEKLESMGRLMLHARSLRVKHPTTGKELFFEAEYANDFQAVLQDLRRSSD